MHVRKRNGTLEPVNVEKILNSVKRVCDDGLENVDFHKIAVKTVGGLYDGVRTRDLDLLSIQTAVGFCISDPVYNRVAARLMTNFVGKEVTGQEIHSFSQSIQNGYEQELIGERCHVLVTENKRKLNAAIKPERDNLFDYYGIKTVYDRYLLKSRQSRMVIETPQYFMMRVACGLTDTAQEAIEFYNLLSSLEYMTSSPTLFNSGTVHSQCSSCFLLDSPLDSLQDIYKRYQDVALLSKWAGGIGLSVSRLRSSGSPIKGTNGKSNGIVPWLHTLSASVAAVDQGSRRKGAAAVYLETHHPDIMEFLELRDNTGEKEKRAYNLNLANWVPDLFMQRVRDDQTWSLFDPVVAPELTDLFGEAYEHRYRELEEEGKFSAQMPARKIFARMMRTLAETGNGWLSWKDTCNKRCNTSIPGVSMVHSSNLCQEIVEPTSCGKYVTVSAADVTPEKLKQLTGIRVAPDTGDVTGIEGGFVSVCNLGSLNVGRGYVKNGKLDIAKLHKNVSIAIKNLDRVIDRNYYPIPEARNSNLRWRPVGLGLMGLQDLFFQLRLPFESDEAVKLGTQVQEEIYYQALRTSCELAKKHGAHKDFELTHAANGLLQFDLAGVAPSEPTRWDALKADIKKHGLRNSLLIAVAPTVTIAAITGAEECIEAQKSNLLKRETLSGEFIAINRFLVDDLKKIGRWNEQTINQLKTDEGSIQNIADLPQEFYGLYKTVWEVSQKKVIDHAVARGAYIDQSQSLNLFVDLSRIPDERRIGLLSSIYMYAWQQGLKTSYYLRSRSATKIAKVTVHEETPMAPESVEICESCQ
jgi:ribonucleoside-diphosphate reductase alpha chain